MSLITRLLPPAIVGPVIVLALTSLASARAPAASRPAGGLTLYVSRFGDDSDGRSWATAYRTIQAALNAVPPGGGHRVIVRPDRYVEANLFPAHPGAPGRYNELVGDHDGRLGSGATGWVIIDSSCPGLVVRTDPRAKGGNPGFVVLDAGGPEPGFKAVDWWGPFRSDPDHSGADWDRWAFRHLYATGAEGGIGWDMTCRAGVEFSAVVEDCVGVGRFAGACVIAHIGRPEEPVVFRRSWFACLDWWGDAGAAYVRACHDRIPDHPDAVFEDCTLVAPDNALECGYPGYRQYTRVRFRGCRLIVTNFSQPHGTPSSGIIHTPLEGRQLHVDLEDCDLMGYTVFGAGAGRISYVTRGACRAYVHHRQAVPEGFEPMGLWPTDVFVAIGPPDRPRGRTGLVKEARTLGELCEAAPVVWHGRLVLLECVRPAAGGTPRDHGLRLRDVESGAVLSGFAEGYGLASAIVHEDRLHVFASRRGDDGTWNDVTHFVSSDVRDWSVLPAVRQEREHIFNSSVCRADDCFVLAYESDDAAYPAFTIKFARSKDLTTWEKIPGAILGRERYVACPCLRYADGWFYILYTVHKAPAWWFETDAARSRDLIRWEYSPCNPILSPGPDEAINTSDPDLVGIGGRTWLYYSIGDQRTWAKLKRACYNGPPSEFLRSLFETR